MDVRCEKCGSEYELDDGKVTTAGVSVKCTTCGAVFRVAKPAAATRAMTGGDWMIRQQGGQVFKFKELTTLQRWIVERRVGREDEISKTGETWKKLGEIFELASFFQVAEQAAGGPVRTPRQQIATIDEVEPRARSGVTMIVVVGLIALGLIAGVFVARRQIAEWVRGPEKMAPIANPTAELADSHVRAAMKELRKDTYAAFAVADHELEKALALNSNHPAALAAATVMLSAWAHYAREEAQEIDANIKAAAAGKIKLGAPELAALASELAKKQAEAAAKTERAFAYMKRALEVEPNGPSGIRAAARYYALTRSHEFFKQIADRAQQLGLGEEPDVLYSLALLRAVEDQGAEAAASLLQRVMEKEPEHIGARYQLAVLAANRNDATRAAQLVADILKASPDHPRALALKGKLEPKADKAPEAASAPIPAAGNESFAELLMKANNARQRERLKQAVDLYERALTMRADNAEALAGLGFCYLDLDQVGNAISQFQKAIASNSRYSDAHMGLAEAYRARGQKRDAVKHYQRYLELTPNGAEAPVARQALKDLGQE